MSDLNIKYAKLFSIIINSTEVINAELMKSVEKAQKTADEANIYKPLGVLGSFYECDSLTDNKPKLIATGKNTKSEMDVEKQKCNEWAKSKLLVNTNTPNSAEHPDYGDGIAFGVEANNQNIYASFSDNGGCFSISNNNKNYHSTAAAADAELMCVNGLDHSANKDLDFL